MRCLFLLWFSCAALAPNVAASQEVVSRSVTAPKAVVAEHQRVVQRFECGDRKAAYYPKYSTWHSIDLDRDNVPELVAFFSIEGFGGGNNWVRYVASYRQAESGYAFVSGGVIGGKGSLSDNPARITLRGNTLRIPAMAMTDKDPMCCPSKKTEIVLDVDSSGRLSADSKRNDGALSWAAALGDRC